MHFVEDATESALVYANEDFSDNNLKRPQFKK